MCAASWWATTTSVRSASAIAGLRDDVPRRARGEQAAAKPLAPAGDVVGDGRRGEGTGGQRRDAAPGQPGGAGQRAEQPHRPPVGPVRALLLHAGVAAVLAQALGDPLGRAALAVGGRRPLERGEVTHHVLELGAQRAASAVTAMGGPRYRLIGHGRPRSRLPVLQDRRRGAAGDDRRRGRAHRLVHGHQPGHPRARARRPARARRRPARRRRRGPRRRARPPRGASPRAPRTRSAPTG